MDAEEIEWRGRRELERNDRVDRKGWGVFLG